MYTAPVLTRVGDAREVILGSIGVGLDLDTTDFIEGYAYAEEQADPQQGK